MNGLKRAIFATVLLAVLIVMASSAMLPSEADDVEKQVLIDMGDGDTYWSPASGGSVADVLSAAARTAGLTLSMDGGKISVDGVSEVTVGSQTAGWRLYSWKDGWEDVTASTPLDSRADTSIAIGIYPAGTVPTETPVHKESWTQVRGNSSMDRGMSADLDSGEEMRTVYAWSRGSNDYVTGTVLVAGGNAYAFFNGGYMNTQSTPALYCADRFTGETKWVMEVPAGVGYETMTGCIVGGCYYLPTSYGYIYKIPLEGPGEDSFYVQLSSRLLTDSKKAPAVTYVGYKNPGDETYTEAPVEALDTIAFDVPVEVGRTYDIRISDGSRVYEGKMTVNSAGALGVKIVGNTAEDKAMIADFSSRVTHSYSDVSKAFVSKTKSPTLEGRNIYNTGPASLTYYGGAIFFGTSAGYTYAMDLDLNVLWKTDVSGQNYYDAVMVDDGRVFVGTYSGKLFALDAATGAIVAYVEAASFPSTVYGEGGRVCTPVKMDDILFFSTSDGLGMNSTQGGFCAYAFKNDAFVKIYSETSY
ncbi:MAG: PQQ-like beta-propeller repeat protein, partial [Candidatus Methanomethylophilaceae archaeon]|nr:PQQ-like beta-propeller repeat protein [Candidatus Methanomethylophilaceae archaeon]